MNNEKINLEDLQVESFITTLTPEEQVEQKGGYTTFSASSEPCAVAVAETIHYVADEYGDEISDVYDEAVDVAEEYIEEIVDTGSEVAEAVEGVYDEAVDVTEEYIEDIVDYFE